MDWPSVGAEIVVESTGLLTTGRRRESISAGR